MDNAPLVNNAEALFPPAPSQPSQPSYPQPQMQPQAIYAQPVYGNSAYNQPQVLTLTPEIKDFFGYVKFVKVVSIIFLIIYIISIVGLPMIWYPIIGMNVSKKWNESSFGCFHCYTWFSFIMGCLSCGYYLVLCFTGAEIDGTYVPGINYLSSLMAQLVSVLLFYYLARASTNIKKGLYNYQIHDIMTKAAYTELYLKSDVPCKLL